MVLLAVVAAAVLAPLTAFVLARAGSVRSLRRCRRRRQVGALAGGQLPQGASQDVPPVGLVVIASVAHPPTGR